MMEKLEEERQIASLFMSIAKKHKIFTLPVGRYPLPKMSTRLIRSHSVSAGDMDLENIAYEINGLLPERAYVEWDTGILYLCIQ